ncbi:putative RNA-directed DNA polymerase from transposon X-element, partial [Stegodyphus mimosarum]
MDRGLLVTTWNANGLHHKIEELRIFINEYSPDILLIQEHKLSPQITFNIANYCLYRLNRPRLTNRSPGGGLIILIKQSITHHQTTIPQLVALEALAITVTPLTSHPLTIISAYVPSNKRSQSNISEDFEALFRLNNHTVIGGDFNALHRAWGCSYTSYLGTVIHRYATQAGITIAAPNTPTRYNDRSANTLDFFLLKGCKFSYVHTINELSSDHSPVMLNLDTSVRSTPDKKAFITNWVNYTKALNNTSLHIPTAQSGEELDELVASFTNELTTALNTNSTSVPERKNVVNPDLRKLIQQRNAARKEWRRTRFPADKTNLNRLNHKVRALSRIHAQQEWATYLTSLSADESSVWKTTTKIKRCYTNIPPLNGQLGIAYTEPEKAESLADHYAS